MEEIQALEEETSEGEFEEENHTLVTPDVGEPLVISRAFHVKEIPVNLLKESKSSTLDVPLEAKCVSLLSIEVVVPMWLL